MKNVTKRTQKSYEKNIENITIYNSSVNYNKNAGSEGYFAMVAGRLHKDTTNMTNIFIDDCEIDCNKYTGALTGNINKGNNCVLNAKNIYCDIKGDIFEDECKNIIKVLNR